LIVRETALDANAQIAHILAAARHDDGLVEPDRLRLHTRLDLGDQRLFPCAPLELPQPESD
jgi:hypothetical protein